MAGIFSYWPLEILAVSDEFCSKLCSLIWTIQIKQDGAQCDVFLPVDVIRIDFLDFYRDETDMMMMIY